MKRVLLWAFLAISPQMLATETVIIEDVTVIDVQGGESKTGLSVIIRGDRIAGVVRKDEWRPAESVRVINGQGKFLIPGLWDMHVHWYDGSTLSLFIANGVTGIRQMMGNPMHLTWRKMIADGKLMGPRQYIASPIFDGPQPIWQGSFPLDSPEKARKAVQGVKKAGADFVKVYSLLPREVYFAIAEESKRIGIPFAGHVPMLVTVEEAVRAGQKSMEHVYGVDIATSAHQQQHMAELAQVLASAANGREAVGVWRGKKKEILDHHDTRKADALFELFAASGTWQCPTLVVLRSIAHVDNRALTQDPNLRYVPPAMKAFWRKRETDPVRKADYRRSLELVGKMFRAGVPLLAGTDVGNPYIAPGFSIHEELKLLVEAGLTPLAALQAATINAARFMGRDDIGAVQVGKLADLVLLDANPLEDIANTAKIHAVVYRGQLHQRETLDQMLKEDLQTQ